MSKKKAEAPKAKGTIKWANVGGGAQQSSDGRFYLQASSRYLGRKSGKPQSERWVDFLDRQTSARRQFDTMRDAKAGCEQILVKESAKAAPAAREEHAVTVDYGEWTSSTHDDPDEPSGFVEISSYSPAVPEPPSGGSWRLVSACPGERCGNRQPVQFFWAREVSS